MPACYFERDYGRPNTGLLMPDLGKLRASARLLALDARVRAAAGDAGGAVEDVAAVFRIAGHLTSDPIFISTLVAMGVHGTAVRALEDVLASSAPSAEDLAALPREDTLSFRRALRRAFLMEEAFGLSVFIQVSGAADVRDFGAIDLALLGGLPFGMRSIWRVYFLPADLGYYRATMGELRRLCSFPCHESREKVDALSKRIETERGGMISGMMLPALTRTLDRAAEADARHGLARVAVAMIAYRAEKGAFPSGLEELVPGHLSSVPVDPFDGKPLRMVLDEGRAVLYSIGPDGKDDGGADFDRAERTGDLAFRLRAPR